MTDARRYLDALERLALEAERSDGATLQELADALGITRQAVHRRVRKL